METSFYITSGLRKPVKQIQQMQKIILSLFILFLLQLQAGVQTTAEACLTPYKPAAQR
jgi:hypothetical protein